jgi:hypothetical protein
VAVAQIWPVGIDRIGSRIYYFFMAVNLVCVPVVYLLYPETKNRALEDMDALFGKGLPAAATGRGGDDEDDDTVALGSSSPGTARGKTSVEPVVLESGRRDG